MAGESYLLDPLRIPVGACGTPQVYNILSSLIARVTKESSFFSVDIVFVHLQMTSQTSGKRICLVTEVTRNTCKLLMMDFCETPLLWFVVTRSHMVRKPSVGQTVSEYENN